MKKILTFLSLSLTGMAASLATGSSLFKSGVYTGLTLGYSYMNAGVQESLSLPALLGGDSSSKGRGTRHGTLGELTLGYHHIFENDFLMGFEVGVAKDNHVIRRNSELGGLLSNIKLQRSFQITPALVMGKVFSEKWLGFAKLGVSFSRFKVRHSIGMSGVPEFMDTGVKTERGLSITLGIEYALTTHMSTVGMVTYEYFNKIKKELMQLPAPFIPSSNTLSFKPYYVTTKVGIVYRF